MNQRLPWLFIFLLVSSFAVGQTNLYHNEWIDYSKTYYKLKVMGFGSDNVGSPVRNGIVRIPYSTLAAAGLSNASSENFQLWRDGEEVPVYISAPSGPLGANDFIEFFGEINNGKLDKELYLDPDYQLNNKWSLQTDTAAYFLTINTSHANKRFVTASNNVAVNTLQPDKYFMYTVGRYFRNEISGGFAASLGKSLYSSSYDKGEGWVSRAIRPNAGCGTATLPQSFVALHPYLQGPLMTLKLNTVGDAQDSRTVTVKIDSDSITTYQMDYINYVKAEAMIDVSKISAGSTTFYVVNNSPAACDEMRTAMIELTYPRVFDMGGASYFNFTLDTSAKGRFIAITNFNNGGVPPVLYDVSNGKRYVGDISNPDTIKIALDPSPNVPYKLVLTTQAGNYYKAIQNIQTRNFIDYSNAANQGNYLIISNPLIYGNGSTNYVEQYRQYRSSAAGGSFTAKVIDANELADQFAWGVKKHPLSVKNFLRYARKTFADSPKYVFIIGKGVTYDQYRENESDPVAEQLNLVPTWGSPASDNLLASDDFTALPAMPIGRLSAVTPQEVGDYLLKVQQHDSIQHTAVQTIASKGWMKNVIHIAGASDDGIGNQIDGYLQGYKKIISDTSFGANVIDFSKNSDPAGYPAAVNSFGQIYENGASLITYFGHSSNTSLDFNLDNPDKYNNPYKYPVFIANGCSSGNNYAFEPDRLNTKSTISEKFVLSPQRGAVGYLASTNFGVINYLDLYTLNFYKALGTTKYGQSVGVVLKEAISASLNATGSNDYFSRVHAEQYAFNGDPAITIDLSSLPDYVIEQPQIEVPSFVSVADTGFQVKVKVNNIGRATNNAVTLQIKRESPNGETTTIVTKTFTSINLVDSFIVNIPVVANRDKGINKITAFADFNNSVAEVSENNNSATIEVLVSEDEIRPIFPYNYAVITQPDVKLSASTVNPLNVSRAYMMQLDTTALFNSAFKITKSITSTGGVIEFDPGFFYKSGIRYYWRVAPDSSSHWVNSSFVYKSNSIAGFEQGHLYQNLQSALTRLSADSTTGKYSFQNKLHNLFITNSIYPTSGTEDEQFSISVDGSNYIRSACSGHSVIFNVFDSLTFEPWKNLTQPFNAAATCDVGREYNFEYQYLNSGTRKNAMDFLDAVPNGSYVSVRLILDDPYTATASQWAADTAIFGKGNSLYHRLKQNGFKAIDSFYYPRTWAFVFRKGDTTFTPVYTLSNGLYDRITLSVNCLTTQTQGYITSPVFGPAKTWKNVYWYGYSEENGNDVPLVNVYGIKNDNSDTLLYSLDSSKHNFDISSVSAIQYPYIRLQMSNADSVSATPYQLTDWGLGYIPVPEGAVAPNLYFNIPDTLGTADNDTLHAEFAFKNVSKADFDSLKVKVILYDSLQHAIVYTVQKLRALQAGDTLHVSLALDVASLNGTYNLYVDVNPDNDQPEQFTFNNFLYKYVYIDKGRTLPVTLLNFNAVLQNSNVKTLWSVATEVNTKQYEVEHSTNGSSFSKIGVVAASSFASPNKDYTYVHLDPPAGKNYYRLKIVDNDGSFKYSPVRLVTVASSVVVNVYPNPVKDILSISVSRQDAKTSDVRIINAFGQQLWQQKVNGTVTVETKMWASGMYIVQVDEGDAIKTFKIQKQ